MLNAIVQFALRFRVVTVALAAAFIGYGMYTLPRTRYDVFPEFAPPQVVIQTEAPGLSPEQVEVLVTQPIENAINGVPRIESLRSNSIQGLSVITMTFQVGSDIYRARQVVAERLAVVVGQLPQRVHAPVMAPLTSSTSDVLQLGLTSDKLSLMDLRTIADWTVKQRLLSVPGVAKVAVFSSEVKQLQIQVRPDRLLKYNMALKDVFDAARQATAIRGAGFIDNENQRIILQTEGQSLIPEQLARTVVLYRNGASVKLGDVAKVVEAPEPPIGAASINGCPGVILVVSAQYGTNTLEVTRKIEQALEELLPTLSAQGVSLHPQLFRPANFIQTAIRNMKSNLLIGALLVVIVPFLFLFNFRTAAISCTAIPLSLLAAVTILGRLGFSLNTMTLGGLAIAVGDVADDAIIDVENIFRRLRENRQSKNPRSVFQVVLDASIEVRGAVVYATFTVLMVFIPILTISGVEGRLFAPLGIAYIVAFLASMLVALTVTPALCILFLARKDMPEKEPPVVRWLKEQYRDILLRVERHPRVVIGGVAGFVVAGLSILPFMGAGLLPELREGHFIIHMSAVPGTSIQESLRLGGRVTSELLKIPQIRSVAQRVGRAELAGDVFGTHYSESNVDLKPLKGEEEFEVALFQIRKELSQFPGVNFAVKTFLTERVEEVLSGYRASVVINIFGNDLDTLDQKAQDVARVMNQIPGATDVYVQSPPGTPQLAVKLRKDDLVRWGLDPVEVLDTIRTAYEGVAISQIYDGNRVFDVSVILDPIVRKNLVHVGSLPLRNSAGTYVHLRQIADIYETSGRYVVLHEGARRVQTVTCNVTGQDLNSFTVEAKKRIHSLISFPPGTYVVFGGAAEAQAQSRRDFLIHSLLAGLGVVFLLSIATKHYRNLLLILLNLPFALVGGVLAVFATGGWLTLGALVGFVTLYATTMRSSIMMISHYEHLVSEEGMTWGLEAAIRGASERLTPILMTVLTTLLGLLPLAIGSGAPGMEIEGPMTQVILGGLTTSTILVLLVLPILTLRYGRFEKKNQAT
ncbi:MAG: efflux RND transporter permease subunit [Candidatus Brocadiaceae bacterium]